MNDDHLTPNQRTLIGTTAYNLARTPGEQRDAKTIYEEICADTPVLSYYGDCTNGLT